MRMPSLEVLRYAPRGVPHATPILFVHGAYVGAWCWDEHFLPYFAEHGYAVYAPSLRGHGESAGRESLDSAGIDDYVADILAVAHSLDTPPILIGHSMGAILVQRALRRSRAPCAVLMTPVPPSGLVVPALALTQRDPELLRDVALLRGMIFRVFAEIAQLSRALNLLRELRLQLSIELLDLLFELFQNPGFHLGLMVARHPLESPRPVRGGGAVP